MQPRGGETPVPLRRSPGGWTPPGVNRGWDPRGGNLPGRSPIDGGNPFTEGNDVPPRELRRNLNDLEQGASAAKDAVDRRDLTRDLPAAADTAKELYDREYAQGSALPMALVRRRLGLLVRRQLRCLG